MKLLLATINPHVHNGAEDLSLRLIQSAPLVKGAALAAGQLYLEGKGGAGGYTYSATGLPAGLSLDPATGAITGAPTAYGHNVITATVTDSATTTSPPATFSVDVPIPLYGVNVTPSTLEENVAYSYAFLIGGATGTVTWSNSTTLPGWLSFNSATGVVSASFPPNGVGPGSIPLSITASDSGTGASFQFDCSIPLVGKFTLAFPPVNPRFNIGQPLDRYALFYASKGVKPYTIALDLTAVAWATDNRDGTISGLPIDPAGTFSIPYTASDALGRTLTGSANITLVYANNILTVKQSGTAVGGAGIDALDFVGATVTDAGGGVRSISGLQGPQGATGAQGATGPQGATGTNGSQGPQGVAGTQGPQGAQGTTGASGSQGPQGATGATGAQGPQGNQGVTGTAVISYTAATNGQTLARNTFYTVGTGVASLTLPTTGLTAGDSIVLTKSATVSTTVSCSVNISTELGSTASIVHDVLASVTFSWDGSKWVMNYEHAGAVTGPQGPQGAAGAAGATGATGSQGPQGATGPSVWGGITGTLSSQSDLNTALNSKANISGQTFTGAITAPGVTDSSDAKFKRDVRDLVGGVATIRAMLPRRFFNTLTGQEEVGFVAQELRDVLPEVVSTDTNGDLAIAYARIVAPIIVALREIDARLKRLESK